MAHSDAKTRRLDSKYDPTSLFLETYNYDIWLEELADTTKGGEEKSADLQPISPLEGDGKEVKEGKELKILIPKKLFIRLLVLLSQMKAGKNSYKLKNEIRQILCLLYQHSKTTKRLYNNLVNLL